MTGTRQALLIEDDVTIASLMLELLRGLGFETRHASRREQAITMAGDARPDVVVTDLMAVGGVAEAWSNVEELRDRLDGVPILVVTGHAGAVAEGELRGIAVLPKPFDLEEFERAVGALLDR
jgi:two-component system, NtrC family, sensor kinase